MCAVTGTTSFSTSHDLLIGSDGAELRVENHPELGGNLLYASKEIIYDSSDLEEDLRSPVFGDARHH